MADKFAVGQRVRIVGVDDIPYGEKYSFLAATIDKPGVVQDVESARYLVRLEDGTLLSLSESCLREDSAAQTDRMPP